MCAPRIAVLPKGVDSLGIPAMAQNLVAWPKGLIDASRLDSKVPMAMPPSPYETMTQRRL